MKIILQSAGSGDPRTAKPWSPSTVPTGRPEQRDRLNDLHRFAQWTSRTSHPVSELKGVVGCLEGHRSYPAGGVSLAKLTRCSWLKYAASPQNRHLKHKRAGLH